MNNLLNLKSATRLAVCLTVLLVAGCAWQDADQSDIKNAESACMDKGGIFYIRIYAVGSERVMCKNGDFPYFKSSESVSN